MAYYIKFFSVLGILAFFVYFVYSHTFTPFDFIVRAPSKLNVKINDEVNIIVTIKNTGMIGDSYIISVTSNYLDISISPSQTTVTLDSQNTLDVPIRLIVYSSISQNRIITLKVCSVGLLNSYNQQERIEYCSAEECRISEGKNCISKDIQINTATFSLGYFDPFKITISLLFSSISAILLGYLLSKRQKPSYDRRH